MSESKKTSIIEVKERVLSLLNEDGVDREYLKNEIEMLAVPPNDEAFFSGLLELFIHLSVDEEEARLHWDKILENYDFLQQKLEHDTGLMVAIVDYFTNLNQVLNSPMLVEINVFKETEKMAMVDALTGIFNRRYFDLNLRKELRRAARYDKDMTIILIDVDNFKDVNDTKGHLFGDLALKNLAGLLTEVCREEDIVCRYGGEEFIFILPETTATGALIFAERFKKRLQDTAFFGENSITISGGIASYPYGGKNVVQLLENADKALYEAKIAGKDRIVTGASDNRRRDRFKLTWKLTCQPLDSSKGGKRQETYTQNVSFGGVKIELDQEYPLDTRLLLDIEMPNGDITIVGKTVWAKKEKSGVYTYGIRFLDLKSEQLQKMIQVLPSDFYDPTEENPEY